MQIAQILRVLVKNDYSKWSSKYLTFLEERRNSIKPLRLELSLLLANYHEESGAFAKAVSIVQEVRQEQGPIDPVVGHWQRRCRVVGC